MRALAVLVDPVGAVPPAVEARAWLVPLVLAMVLSAAASAAIATRLDTARVVLPRLEAAGELAKASEREIAEQVEQAQRVAIVAGVAKGIFGVPALALVAALGLWLMAWLVGGRTAFVESFTVICLALLPVAVGQGVTLAAALNQRVIAPKGVQHLVPSSLGAVLEARASAEEVPKGADRGASGADAAHAAKPGKGADRASSGASAEELARGAHRGATAEKVGERVDRGASGADSGRAWKPMAGASLLGLADFFHLWSAVLLGLGFAAATRRARWQAVPIGVVLYFVTVAAVTIGLPGLAEGGPR
ncbi:MAG: YIP1 family protein [Myxococcaceae bacterium]|nr:YIP1 family protein [Myxococcaceae bacterium]